uniref:50S ribosomal protein L6 n=1 Tax=candidate division WOR-3 bacterium TaxID=2052148 RepID=A0A7C4XL04_UNCW3
MAKKRNKPIIIPENVSCSLKDNQVIIKGPLGELSLTISKNVKVEVKEKSIYVLSADDSKESFAQQGTTWTLISNMITGVTNGYTKTLIVQGTGYRAQLGGGGLQLFLGYTKPVTIPIPPGIKCELQMVKSADKGDLTYITVKGIDKQLVGDVAALIRRTREPDPYKHKGVRYENEFLRKKVGKRAVVQAT